MAEYSRRCLKKATPLCPNAIFFLLHCGAKPPNYCLVLTCFSLSCNPGAVRLSRMAFQMESEKHAVSSPPLKLSARDLSALLSSNKATAMSRLHLVLVLVLHSRGGTPILGNIRDVRPEWMSFPGQKPADGCKFLTKNLRMGHNFDIILPGNGWFSSKLNKIYCSLVSFCYK